jgi:NADPH:quinone reductase-like Zn-dependent oxidoreductase
MRAVLFDRYGDSGVLSIREVPLPTAGPGEVLVRVRASGVNPKDAMVRSGALRMFTGRQFPRGTGFDFAGEVAALGAGVADLQVGQRVWGFLDGFLGGAAAEYLVAPQGWLCPMPERLDWAEAAAIPLVASTALQALRDVARLAPGERLLIRGASGGVGSAAIQIGAWMRAHITASASGSGLSHCLELGADAVVDYRQGYPVIRRECFDVFLDCVGGSSIRRYAGLLRRGGRWVTVAVSVPVYLLAPVSRIFSALGLPAFGFVAVRPRRADLEQIAELVERGALRMPVTATYSLEQTPDAHDAAAARHGPGKRVIVVATR